jgi:hypothetical protein
MQEKNIQALFDSFLLLGGLCAGILRYIIPLANVREYK